MRSQPKIETLSDEEEHALRASAKPMRRGFVLVLSVAVLCGAFSTALAMGGAAKRDLFLLAIFLMCVVGCSIEASRMKRHLASIAATLAAGRKEIHRTKVERVSFQGGTTNPRYYLTLDGLGTLLYRPVPGLSLISPATLKEGQDVEVHLAGNPQIFLRMTPNPSIERTSPGKPSAERQAP